MKQARGSGSEVLSETAEDTASPDGVIGTASDKGKVGAY